RRLAVHLPREHPGAVAVLRQGAPGGPARGRADHGGRRAPAAARRRDPGDEAGPLPHPRLLPAHRRDRVRGRHAGEDHRRDAGGDHLRAPGPGDRPRPVGLHGEEEAGGLLLMGVVEDYLRQHEGKDLLRFITCGSVDDGKSTLIGRLLHDTKLLLDDQLSALEADSKRHGTQNGEIDFALLVDGLAAEREQGITIDVAYRFFGTDRRKFIVADCPGHEQYTRNMATGASTADLAMVLVDARKGLLTQTRRHSYIVSLLGIRHVVLAVNKMDLVGYDQGVFDAIAEAYRALADTLGIAHVTAIPLAALHGDNMLAPSPNMPWYQGEPLLQHLETVQVERDRRDVGFRMPVQWVCRPDQDFRGFSGTVAAGTVALGDAVTVLPSGQRSTVARIVTADGDLDAACAGQAVVLALDDEIDASRGDVIAAAAQPPEISDQFAAHMLWMGEQPLLPGRPYWLRIGTRIVGAQVTDIRHKVDV